MNTRSCYPDKSPKIDALMNTLSHHLRREVINYFENYSDTKHASLDELVRHVDRRIPHSTNGELRTKMVHLHLPQLEERSWIEYDSPSKAVRYHRPEHAKRYLSDLHAVF